jgi:hypothetical protein
VNKQTSHVIHMQKFNLNASVILESLKTSLALDDILVFSLTVSQAMSMHTNPYKFITAANLFEI